MKWFLHRLSEPSSAASLSGVASAVSGALYAGVPWSVALTTGLIPAVLGFIMTEKSHG